MQTGVGYVYALLHEPTGKIYVGRTEREPEYRVRQHICALRNHYHPNKIMQSDYDEYGDKYSYYVLYISSDFSSVRGKEREFMGLLKTRDPKYGYNTNDHSRDLSIKDFKKNAIPEEWGRCGNKKLSKRQICGLVESDDCY